MLHSVCQLVLQFVYFNYVHGCYDREEVEHLNKAMGSAIQNMKKENESEAGCSSKAA